MNLAPPEPVRWTQRRWVYAVGLIFVVQAGSLFLLGERPGSPPRARRFPTKIDLAADAEGAKQVNEFPLLLDPTVFALPHRHGFSEGAWLHSAPLGYQWEDWKEAPTSLALDISELGRSFSEYLAANATPPLLIADKPIARLIGSDLFVTNQAAASHSELVIEGELEQLPMLRPLALRSWEHSDILSNSVVQLLVNEDGATVSAALLEGCGSPEADRSALELATAAMFQTRGPSKSASDRRELAAGRLIFRWHTLPKTSTNTLAERP